MRLDYGLAVVAYLLVAFVSLWIVDRVPGRRAVRSSRPASPPGGRTR